MNLFSFFKSIFFQFRQLPPLPVGTDIKVLEDMFSKIKRNTDWDIEGKMQWNYFFIDGKSEKLSRLAETLEERGFKIVEITKVENQYMLIVSEENIHTPESLLKNNTMFHQLASEYNITSYDGYDVGQL